MTKKAQSILMVRTATKGQELKTAVRYYLRSIGLEYNRPTRTWNGIGKESECQQVRDEIRQRYGAKVLNIKIATM